MSQATLESPVEDLIESKLTNFEDKISENPSLEIDSYNDQTDNFKILNHAREVAYEISLDDILKQDVNELVEALSTGISTKLFGVTRIVGYYSRMQNWNKSKISELEDRARGNYWESKRFNAKDTLNTLENL